MNTNEIKTIVDRIISKEKEAELLVNLKTLITDRTTTEGMVTIVFEQKQVEVDAVDFAKLIDKTISKQDTATDVAELKNKVK